MTLTAARVDKGHRLCSTVTKLCSVTKRGKMATRVKWFDLLVLPLRVTVQLNSLFPPRMTMMLQRWMMM